MRPTHPVACDPTHPVACDRPIPLHATRPIPLHATRPIPLHAQCLLQKELGARNDADTPTDWLNPPFGSFDDFPNAMLILFIASTGDGWEDFMHMGMDAIGPGIAPQRNDFSPIALYFIM
jgi:hypothetical protein